MKRKSPLEYSVLFTLPAVFLYTFFFILPNVLSLFLSFTDWSSYNITSLNFVGLDNFKQMLVYPIFFPSIINTLYFTAVTVVIKTALGFFLALALDSNIKAKNIHRTIIFSPVVMNFIVVGIIFKSVVFDPYNGVINKVLQSIGLGFLKKAWLADISTALNSVCIMDIWMGAGMTMIIFIAALQSVPKEYYEAATIDGAGSLRRMVHITLPLIIHSVTVNFLLNLVNGTKVFGQVYALTNGGPVDSTQVYGTFMFKAFSEGLFGFSSAANLLFTIAICTLSFIVLKIFRRREVEY